MNFRLNSIKVKLTAFYSAILVAILVVFGLFSWALLSYGLFHSLDTSLAADFSKARDAIVQSGSNNLSEPLSELDSVSGGSLFIYDVESKSFIGNPTVTEDIITALSGFISLGSSTSSQQLNTSDGRMRLYIAPLDTTIAPGKLLVVTRDTDYIYQTLDEYQDILFMSIPFVLLIATAAGYFFANHSLKPVNIIARTAENIDPANLSDRIQVKGNDELGRLSKTLNSLFDRIYGFIERQRQFTTDASHDLRAPLTTIKAETSLALRKERPAAEYRSALEIVNRETDRLNSLVDDLLTLASMDSNSDCTKSCQINLSDLMESVLSGWESPCVQRGIKLNRQISPDIKILGEIPHFQRIANTLLENAVKATPDGGSVNFSLADRGCEITLTVTDTGIGIAKEYLGHIFNRFYKVNHDTKGNGLGLPIVEGMVKMYKGRIDVETAPDKGSVFRVFLPKNSHPG